MKQVRFNLATLPVDCLMVTIEIPDDIAIGERGLKDLPPDWNELPPLLHSDYRRAFGRLKQILLIKNAFRSDTGRLHNILTNPDHPDFHGIRKSKEKFPFNNKISRQEPAASPILC